MSDRAEDSGAGEAPHLVAHSLGHVSRRELETNIRLLTESP
jgi:hypothetical protein